MALASAIVLAATTLPGAAHGERTRVGNLVGTLNGSIAPRALPRSHPAPVSVDLEGKIGTTDGTPLPRFKQVTVELAGSGVLSTQGLPSCPQARLHHADDRQAMERCGPALVGSGTLDAEINIPNQAPFALHAKLLAFNGRTSVGRSAIWVHVYASDPPVSFVLPFVVHPGSRSFPTAFVAIVPRSVGPLPSVANFRLHLFRRFRSHGSVHSFVSASCPVPPAFTAGFAPFARATYSFGDGQRVRVDTVRSCRASN
ncbi:MAG TPA: hypothetical protein VGI17_04530 [Solirubrobacterales bacterium]|jgi:hypothetical protein